MSALDGKSYYISNKVGGDGFTVKLSGFPTADSDFQYWIVDSDLDYAAWAQDQTQTSTDFTQTNTDSSPLPQSSPVQGEEVNPSPVLPSEGVGGSTPASTEPTVEPAPPTPADGGVGAPTESVGAEPPPQQFCLKKQAKICYNAYMYNWSVDEKAFKKADPEKYQIWRLEQAINYGLGKEKLKVNLVRKYWDRIYMDTPTRKYLKFLLWPQKTETFSRKSK